MGTGITLADVEHRFTNHPPSSDVVADLLDQLTAAFIDVGMMLASVLPDSREASLAMTHLEQSSMWSKAAVARNQPGD